MGELALRIKRGTKLLWRAFPQRVRMVLESVGLLLVTVFPQIVMFLLNLIF